MKTLIAVVLSLVCSLAMAEEKPAVSEPKPVRVKEGERKDNVTRFGGTIAVVTASSLTVTMGGGDGGRAPREETVSLNAETKVLVESDEMEEVKGEGGQKRQRAKKVDGAVADLKVGQRVYVRAKDGVATEILVPRVAAKREGGEGGRKEAAPAPQPRRGEGER